jgi:hypothetical protein
MEDKTIALLVDMDNVSAKYVKNIFDELNEYGIVSIRRIYGNWKKTSDWNENILLEYSMQPIQQIDYTNARTRRTWPWSLMPWIFCILIKSIFFAL